MSRRLARELAFQIMFQIDMGKCEVEQSIKDRFAESTLGENELKFTRSLVEGTCSYLSEINSLISRYSHDWKIERISGIDRNLLRMAIYEMLHSEDVPAKIAINEAIELAKVFGSDESPKFINGILGAIIKDLPEHKPSLQ